MRNASMTKNVAYVIVPVLLVILLLSCYVYFSSTSTKITLEGKESDKVMSLCVSSYEKENGRLFNPQITKDFSSSNSRKSPYSGMVTGMDSSGVPFDVWCVISQEKHGKFVVKSVSSSPTL